MGNPGRDFLARSLASTATEGPEYQADEIAKALDEAEARGWRRALDSMRTYPECDGDVHTEIESLVAAAEARGRRAGLEEAIYGLKLMSDPAICRRAAAIVERVRDREAAPPKGEPNSQPATSESQISTKGEPPGRESGR